MDALLREVLGRIPAINSNGPYTAAFFIHFPALYVYGSGSKTKGGTMQYGFCSKR